MTDHDRRPDLELIARYYQLWPDGLSARIDDPTPIDEPPAAPLTYIAVTTDGTALAKIGQSVDPAGRVAALHTSSPHPLRLAFTTDTPEADLHQRFARHRQHREWFRVDGDLADWITTNSNPEDNP